MNPQGSRDVDDVANDDVSTAVQAKVWEVFVVEDQSCLEVVVGENKSSSLGSEAGVCEAAAGLRSRVALVGVILYPVSSRG